MRDRRADLCIRVMDPVFEAKGIKEVCYRYTVKRLYLARVCEYTCPRDIACEINLCANPFLANVDRLEQ